MLQEVLLNEEGNIVVTSTEETISTFSFAEISAQIESINQKIATFETHIGSFKKERDSLQAVLDQASLLKTP